MHFSLTPTCPRRRVEPWRYLGDVLERLPSHPPAWPGGLRPYYEELIAEYLPPALQW